MVADHFAPHANAGFEGFYSRTQTDNGGTIAIVFCWVKDARTRPNLVHVSYTPPAGGTQSAGLQAVSFKHEFFPPQMKISLGDVSMNGSQLFTIAVSDLGTMKIESETIEYSIDSIDTDLHLRLKLTNPTPWSRTKPSSGPMGFIALFSDTLPLNWHVQSLCSIATYDLTYAGVKRSGSGVSHVEKNWGTSFPHGWLWGQSFGSAENGKSLCFAGGAALPGVHAYLIGYRSPKLRWDFRPLWTVSIGPFSPFMHVKHDSKAGRVELSIQTLLRRLVIKVSAPKDSFMALSCPLQGGFRPAFAYESFQARTWVEAWGRAWPWQKWKLVEEGYCGTTEDGVPCSALEFGGSFSHMVSQNYLV